MKVKIIIHSTTTALIASAIGSVSRPFSRAARVWQWRQALFKRQRTESVGSQAMYAGIFFELTDAAASRAADSDIGVCPLHFVVIPLVFVVLVVAFTTSEFVPPAVTIGPMWRLLAMTHPTSYN
jgi:hypothetical protein